MEFWKTDKYDQELRKMFERREKWIRNRFWWVNCYSRERHCSGQVRLANQTGATQKVGSSVAHTLWSKTVNKYGRKPSIASLSIIKTVWCSLGSESHSKLSQALLFKKFERPPLWNSRIFPIHQISQTCNSFHHIRGRSIFRRWPLARVFSKYQHCHHQGRSHKPQSAHCSEHSLIQMRLCNCSNILCVSFLLSGMLFDEGQCNQTSQLSHHQSETRKKG